MAEHKHSNSAQPSDMDKLHEVYQVLQEKIREWQEERGGYWVQRLIPDETYPYFSLNLLPKEPVLELAERLLEESGRLWSKEELQSAWNRYCLGQEFKDQELFSKLAFAVQGVLGLARKSLTQNLLQTGNYTGQVCPICGQEAGLAVLVPPVGKRMLHCTQCGHEWPAKRVGCIHCGDEEASEQTYLKNDLFPGVEIVFCHTCGRDFKEVDLRQRKVEDFAWEEIRTLPLNYALEKWINEQPQKKQVLN